MASVQLHLWRSVCIGAVALMCAGAVIIPTLSSRIVGLFHDDAIYAASARSLCSGRGYRLEGLPVSLAQTKYPPMYPALLALAWCVHPDFPANALLLKLVGLPFLVLGLTATYRLYRRLSTGTPAAAAVAAALVLTNPAVMLFSDFALTEIVFLGLLTLLVAGWVTRDGSGPRTAALMLLAGLLPLTRLVGVAVGVAFLLEAVTRRRRDAGMIGATAIVTFLGWELWRTFHPQPENPLLRYYTAYETSALGHLRTNPELAWQIITGNLGYLLNAPDWLMGPAWWLVGPVFLAIAGVGLVRLEPSVSVVRTLLIVYVGTVMLHPFAPHRYLIPVVPLLVLCTLHGAQLLWRPLYGMLTPGWNRGPVSGGALIAGGLLLLGNAGVYKALASPSNGNVRGWMQLDLGYSFVGFEETFAWVRANTHEDAVLGSMFDPMYALYTGRRAVRPWIHHAETYYYGEAAIRPFVGRPDEVGPALAELGVTHLMLDPPTGYAEGQAGISLLRELIATNGVQASRVFVSGDGRHEVYEVRWPERWSKIP